MKTKSSLQFKYLQLDQIVPTIQLDSPYNYSQDSLQYRSKVLVMKFKIAQTLYRFIPNGILL